MTKTSHTVTGMPGPKDILLSTAVFRSPDGGVPVNATLVLGSARTIEVLRNILFRGMNTMEDVPIQFHDLYEGLKPVSVEEMKPGLKHNLAIGDQSEVKPEGT